MKKKIILLLANIIVSLFPAALASQPGQQGSSKPAVIMNRTHQAPVQNQRHSTEREFGTKPKQQKSQEQLRFEKKQAVSKGLPAEGIDKAIREFNQNLSR